VPSEGSLRKRLGELALKARLPTVMLGAGNRKLGVLVAVKRDAYIGSRAGVVQRKNRRKSLPNPGEVRQL